MSDNSKYEGKTAAELVEMMKHQDEFIGEQSKVVGELRSAVRSLDSQVQAARKPVETGSTRKEDYKTRLTVEEADNAILNPREGLGKVMDKTREQAVEEAEQRVMAKINQKQQMDAQVDAYMRANPVLQKWQDVFSVAGAQIFNSNPNAPLNEILEGAKKATLEWLQQKGIKAEVDGKTRERVVAGITTSGGTGTRDTEGITGRRAPDDDGRERADTGNPEHDNVLNAISEIKTWRANRILPPRSGRIRPTA